MTYIYGVSSKIPFPFSNFHWLLLDIDSERLPSSLPNLFERLFPGVHREHWRTPHGHHFIVFQPFTFEQCLELMPLFPIDLKWFKIGCKRGYWFLWTRTPLNPYKGYTVTFMRLNIPEANEWLDSKT